jgi:hypothetical protein
MPTEDRVVQAGICVYDYVLYPAMRGEFNRVLASVKASPDNGSKILQDFSDADNTRRRRTPSGRCFRITRKTRSRSRCRRRACSD